MEQPARIAPPARRSISKPAPLISQLETLTPSPIAARDSLPALPLKNVVVFPGASVPLFVGRPLSIQAVEAAVRLRSKLFLVAQRDADLDDPRSLRDLHRVGVISEVSQVSRLADGNLKITVTAERRARLERWAVPKPALGDGTGGYRAGVQVLPPDGMPAGVRVQAFLRFTQEQWQRYVELNKRLSAEAALAPDGAMGPGRLADALAAQLQVGVGEKQLLLAERDPLVRLEKVSQLLGRELEILEVEREIRRRVRDQMDKGQRDYYLREQLRAIQDELGDGNPQGESDEYRQRIRASSKAVSAGAPSMPEEVAEKLLREVDRLEKLGGSAPEAAVLRSYMDLALALPWSERSEDRLDLKLAEQLLDDEHFGLEQPKQRILEFLAVRQLTASGVARADAARPAAGTPAADTPAAATAPAHHTPPRGPSPRGPILCLVGPPGVGKTSLGESIARALNRKFVRLSLGGVRDEAEIRGHRRTYVGAMPGRILQALRTVGTKNPVVLLDEVDKLAADFRGDPAAALLEVLDPEQNFGFSDHYLELPFDLSEVFFITTANLLWPIPRPLQDRMEVISLPGYTEQEKVEIARRFLTSKQVRAAGLESGQIKLTVPAFQRIINEYTREAGVRSLERNIGTICRKVAREVVSGKSRPSVRVDAGQVGKYLGPARFKPQQAGLEPLVGTVQGLAWTEVGGVLMPVEVLTLPGKGDVQITGSLGDVMRESARAGLSYARSRADVLGLDHRFQEKLDLHLHIPEGAVPKDGPSAGITIATALISALTGRPVRSDLAMTGEITLRGRVLPVGGLRDKILAAHRHGILTVIIPEDNRADLENIAPAVRRKMTFLGVRDMDEVLAIALLPALEVAADEAAAEEQADSVAAAMPPPPVDRAEPPAAQA